MSPLVFTIISCQPTTMLLNSISNAFLAYTFVFFFHEGFFKSPSAFEQIHKKVKCNFIRPTLFSKIYFIVHNIDIYQSFKLFYEIYVFCVAMTHSTIHIWLTFPFNRFETFII